MKPLLLVLFLIAVGRGIAEEVPDRVIVWNVGQGSWTTVATQYFCIHFDMGGERSPHRKTLDRACRNKENYLALSHLDFDHIRFIRKMARSFRLCLIDKGVFPRHKTLRDLAACRSTPPGLEILRRGDFTKRNDSNVYLWDRTLLVTGDAYKKQEVSLIRDIRDIPIRYVVVGHHGSKTSSSPDFVRALTHLRQGIVSARRGKYGHPHERTEKTFRTLQRPLLRTEDFGHLVFEL